MSRLSSAEDVLKVAFKHARRNWMFTDEETCFRGGLGAALIRLKSGPEYERVVISVQQLGRLSALIGALQQGIPVDIESLESPPADLIPLQQLWEESKP